MNRKESQNEKYIPPSAPVHRIRKRPRCIGRYFIPATGRMPGKTSGICPKQGSTH